MGRQRVASLSGYASEPPPANAHAQRRRSGVVNLVKPVQSETSSRLTTPSTTSQVRCEESLRKPESAALLA